MRRPRSGGRGDLVDHPPSGKDDQANAAIGALLLAIPGFVTDAVGALLMFGPTRALARRRISRHYAGRVMSFVTTAGRFAPGERRAPPADVASPAVDDDPGQLVTRHVLPQSKYDKIADRLIAKK